MTETITLKLPKYDNVQEVIPITNLLKLFPGSFLSTVLEQDSKATEIELTMPFLTKEILTFLAEMINTQSIPETLPSNLEDLKKSGDYLGIDILVLLADPLYASFHTQYAMNLLDPTVVNTNYMTILTYTIQHGFTQFLQYILARTNPEDHEEDTTLLGLSVIGNYPVAVRMFLSRGANPKSSSVSQGLIKATFPSSRVQGTHILEHALYADIDIFNVLLHYFPFLPQNFLGSAKFTGRYDIIEMLLDMRLLSIYSLTNALSSLWSAPISFLQKILDAAETTPEDINQAIQNSVVHDLVEPIVFGNSLPTFYQEYPQRTAFFRTIAAHSKAPGWARQVYMAFYYISLGQTEELKGELKAIAIKAHPYIPMFLSAAAIRYNRLDILQHLYTNYLSRDRNFYDHKRLVEIAAYNGFTPIVQYLLTLSKLSKSDRTNALKLAQDRGFTEIAALLR